MNVLKLSSIITLVLITCSCVNLKKQEHQLVGRWIPDKNFYRDSIFVTPYDFQYGIFSSFHIRPADTFTFYKNHQFCLKVAKENLSKIREDSVLGSVFPDSMVAKWQAETYGFSIKEYGGKGLFKVSKLNDSKLNASFGYGFRRYKLRLIKLKP